MNTSDTPRNNAAAPCSDRESKWRKPCLDMLRALKDLTEHRDVDRFAAEVSAAGDAYEDSEVSKRFAEFSAKIAEKAADK